MTERHVEPLGQVRTKIVATLGPASRAPETLVALLHAGVDLFRLNFSHASHEEHSETFRRIRAASAATGREVGVLQDLCGPKIRLGPVAGDAVECHPDAIFTLARGRTVDDPHVLTCTYEQLADDLRPGDDVYFADGTVAMVVTDTAPGLARMRVTLPGRVRSHQGINLPGANLSVPCLTGKDLADLDWTATHPVDFVGLSFVREASDVARLRQELERRGSKARIVVKIEKPQAVERLDEIVVATDAVMVARGDLGVELDVARVPAIQKRVISACRRARVPVITATQMLNSMESSNRPTRAEASDVFNAVLDGSDAVMLSGESAIGQYPVEAVATMSRIAAQAETLLKSAPGPCGLVARIEAEKGSGRAALVQPITDAIVDSVRHAARRLDARLVVVATKSGRTALALSKQRYGPPTLALTDDPAIARRMTLYWGVTPLLCPVIDDHEKTVEFVRGWALHHELVRPGDHIIVVQGTMPGRSSHNAMIVVSVDAPEA